MTLFSNAQSQIAAVALAILTSSLFIAASVAPGVVACSPAPRSSRNRKDLTHEHSRHRTRHHLLGHPRRYQRRPRHHRLIRIASRPSRTQGTTIMNVIASALAAITSVVFIAASIGPGVIV